MEYVLLDDIDDLVSTIPIEDLKHFGVPETVVQRLAAFEHYEDKVPNSIRRQPAHHRWMVL